MSANSSKANPTLYLSLVLIALIAFIVMGYMNTLQEFDTVRAQMMDIRSQNKKDIDSLSDQIRQRYLTVLKQAQDIDDQQAKLQAIDRAIMGEKEALGTIEDSFHTELLQMKKEGLNSTKQVADLEEQFNQEVKVKELKLAKLQDDYLNIKNEVEDQQTLLVMMREQSLLDKYKPQEGKTSVDAGASPTGTEVPDARSSTVQTVPTNGDTYNTAPSTTIVPTNNRVVTDLPSPNGTPNTDSSNSGVSK